MDKYYHYINGNWTGHHLPDLKVTNPASGVAIGSIPIGKGEEARKAVDAAHGAFLSWSAASAYERSRLLNRWHDLLEAGEDSLARLMTMEQGKPIRESRAEWKYARGFLSWYAEEAKRIYGDTIPATVAEKRILVLRQPVGVCGIITPWNFPAAMIARKVGPALAAGCTVVIKPANQTPLSCLMMARYAEEGGIPPGVINVVTGNSKEIGKAWMDDDRVRKVSFTGSTEVGKILIQQSAATVKKLSMELGGHAPFLVFEDADLDKAIEGAIATKFRNAGQTCICANRFYVHESLREAFLEKLIPRVESLKIGDGLNEDTDIGPLINAAAVEKVLEHVSDATSRGAMVATGGIPGEGSFFRPTVLANVSDAMVCMSEETFGPVLPVTTFSNEQEVIVRANGTPFGLASYIYTRDLHRALRVSEALEFGIVGLNDGAPSTPQAPFGGVKHSGFGREGGRYGLDEYLYTKYISIGL